MTSSRTAAAVFGGFQHPLHFARRVPATAEQFVLVTRVIEHLRKDGIRCPAVEFRAPAKPIDSPGCCQWVECAGSKFCRILLDSKLTGRQLVYTLVHEAAHYRDFRAGLHSMGQPALEARAVEYGEKFVESYRRAYPC